MAPWITLGIAALLGAIAGGPSGFLLGLIVGFVFNMTIGTLVNRSRARAQLKIGAALAARMGAPPPPYPLDSQDHVCARRIASMLPGCVVREVPGQNGPTLELVLPALSPEPIAIFGRIWDPDRGRIGTLLTCSGHVEAPVVRAAEDAGLDLMGASELFTFFTRF